MLVLTRKIGEEIIIDEEICVTIVVTAPQRHTSPRMHVGPGPAESFVDELLRPLQAWRVARDFHHHVVADRGPLCGLLQ